MVELPISSRVKTALLEAEPHERWGPLEYLLADMCDWLQYVSLITAYKGSKGQPPKLKPMRRPTDVQQAKESQKRLRDETYDRFMQVKAALDAAHERKNSTPSPEVTVPQPQEA